MTFDDFNLDPRITACVRDAGFTIPTPIQAQSIPATLAGRDVLGLAQTGTGKTAAFLLPILNSLTVGKLRCVRALIVAPTRELAEQISDESRKLSAKTRITTIAIYGGVGKQGQIDKLRKGAEIVVACPGRLLDLINDNYIDLSNLEFVVLDEADRMFDMGFLPDIKRIFRHIPKERQTLLFSATMPNDIRKLADDYLTNPATVQIGIIAPAKTVSHALYPVPDKQKKLLLLAMLDQLKGANQLLIFTRTKHRARNLARDLGKEGYEAMALQGNMSQNQRQKAITGFRDSKFDILVATDIAARGIDVSNVSHVINFDMPDTVDAYTHRIGRTGRAQATGEAFSFTTADDNIMVRDIEKLLGHKIERRELPGFVYQEPEEGSEQQRPQTPQPSHQNRSKIGGQGKPAGGNRNRNRQRKQSAAPKQS